MLWYGYHVPMAVSGLIGYISGSVKENVYYDMKNANKHMQQTKTALASFGIPLSHSGLVLSRGVLPVVRARFWLLKASVSHLCEYKILQKYQELEFP